jgi:hypothetical protein
MSLWRSLPKSLREKLILFALTSLISIAGATLAYAFKAGGMNERFNAIEKHVDEHDKDLKELLKQTSQINGKVDVILQRH